MIAVLTMKTAIQIINLWKTRIVSRKVMIYLVLRIWMTLQEKKISLKSQLPTSLTSRSKLLLPTTDEKPINIIPKKLQMKAQSH